ncbi:MAG: hypothetical protein LBC97_13155 [Bifidobacteriaceae bacterium]|jgi:hypothetical protein|nr:hypothetical protein [Bifidobacteriaceae bacterium]
MAAELKTLYLDDKTAIPDDIRESGVESLWLRGQCVFDAPEAVTQAAAIRELHLSYWARDFIPRPAPEWVFELEGLERLYFNVNRFSGIGDGINRLTSLVELDFGCSLSDLEHFPDLSGLAQLKSLAASGEAVQGQRLPRHSLFPEVLEGIKGLSQLTTLDLSFWKPSRKADWLVGEDGRRSIPDVFDRRPNLEDLHLYGMGLDVLPRSILALPHLKKLNIRNNPISRDEVKLVIAGLPGCRIHSDVLDYKPRKR